MATICAVVSAAMVLVGRPAIWVDVSAVLVYIFGNS